MTRRSRRHLDNDYEKTEVEMHDTKAKTDKLSWGEMRTSISEQSSLQGREPCGYFRGTGPGKSTDCGFPPSLCAQGAAERKAGRLVLTAGNGFVDLHSPNKAT
jgi:hypothetical protein